MKTNQCQTSWFSSVASIVEFQYTPTVGIYRPDWQLAVEASKAIGGRRMGKTRRWTVEVMLSCLSSDWWHWSTTTKTEYYYYLVFTIQASTIIHFFFFSIFLHVLTESIYLSSSHGITTATANARSSLIFFPAKRKKGKKRKRKKAERRE
jgi:hypothetical protein